MNDSRLTIPDLEEYVWIKDQVSQKRDPGLREVLEESLQDYAEMNRLWHEIMAETGSEPLGVELCQKRGHSYAVISADASEPGRFRATYFTEIGFTGHATYDTAVQVLKELLKERYLVRAGGAMQRLSATDRWKQGMEQLEVITAHNAGQINHEAFYQRMQEIAQRYATAEAA